MLTAGTARLAGRHDRAGAVALSALSRGWLVPVRLGSKPGCRDPDHDRSALLRWNARGQCVGTLISAVWEIKQRAMYRMMAALRAEMPALSPFSNLRCTIANHAERRQCARRSRRGLITQRNEEGPTSAKPIADYVAPSCTWFESEETRRLASSALIELLNDLRGCLNRVRK